MQVSTRILVVDGSALFRRILTRYLTLLDAGYQVIGEAATDEAALREVARLHPHIVLLDLDLPDRSGVGTIRDIRRHWPTIAIIAVTNHLDREYCDAARAAGARDCLDKLALVEKLPTVLAAVSSMRPAYLGEEDALENLFKHP